MQTISNLTMFRSVEFITLKPAIPVTTAEVAKARISPLAMSLVKPPEPEVMKTMSFREQRDYMARHAESTLTAAGSRSDTKPCDPRSLPAGVEHDEFNVVLADTEEVVKPKDILKTTPATELNGIDKETVESQQQPTGLVKPEANKTNSEDLQSILTDEVPDRETDVKETTEAEIIGKVETEMTNQSYANGNKNTDKFESENTEFSVTAHEFRNYDKGRVDQSAKVEIQQQVVENTNLSDTEREQSYESALDEATDYVRPDEGLSLSTYADDSLTSSTTNKTNISNSMDQFTKSSDEVFCDTNLASSSDYNTASDLSDMEYSPPYSAKTLLNRSESIPEEIPSDTVPHSCEFKNGDFSVAEVIHEQTSTPSDLLKSAGKDQGQDENKNIVSMETVDSENQRLISADIIAEDSMLETAGRDSKNVLSHKLSQNLKEVERITEKKQETDTNVVPETEQSRIAITRNRLQNKFADNRDNEDMREKRRWERNDAVARRRVNREFRKQGERYHTQPVDGQQGLEDHKGSKRLTSGHTRHHTQPVTPTEKQAAEIVAESPTRSSSGNSIADRLASLHKSGDEAWRRRIGKRESASPSSSSDSENLRIRETRTALLSKEESPEPVRLRNRASELRSNERPHSLADRLSLLGNAQGSWRNRVEEKDMSKFTVEGKLSAVGKMADSPIVRKGVQKKNALSRVTTNGETPTMHQSPLEARKANRSTMPPLMQDIALRSPEQAASTPNIPASFSILQDGDHVSSDSEKEVEKTTPKSNKNKVAVPRLDDETFQAFYQHKDAEVVLRNKVTVTVDDFDHVFMESEDILTPTRKTTRPQNRKHRASRNPLKALAQRVNVQEEYTEEIHGVAERELKRIKTEQIAGKACIASEALAGLASKESFDKTKLRKAESFSGLSPGADKFLPYSDLMLLQVKGRRTCQTRLVKPHASSINSGDAFVLVLPDKIYVWLGEFCNIIEKAKALDVASTIQQKRDMGCKSMFDPITIYESKALGSSAKQFWKHLGGLQEYQDPGPPEEDELYEMYINQTNIVYRVKDEKLLPLKDYWGKLLKYEMLRSKDMYVFDFGTEVYLWTGKQVPFASRKTGLKLLEEIWKKGYDYTNCDINPLSPLHTAESGGSPTKSNTRPRWALQGKVNQNMETILFREKFIDWPDSGKVIKVKDNTEKDTKTEVQVELTPCDVSVMLTGDTSPVDLVLEGSHVGRGDQWIDAEDGIRRVYQVKTLDVGVWHVMEYEHYKLDEISFGQFHEGDTYVIKWHYMITQAGIKSLKGKEARNVTTGREKCAYFFWQGRHSSINEQGASALMTVELDEERGPQVRVVQGKEPPAFVQLFNGRMVTHVGKREDETTNTQGDWRLFLVRNELPNECYLQEITPCVQSLRSRASFVLLNVKSGQMYVWHGAKSSSQTREVATSCVKHIKDRTPPEIGFTSTANVCVTEIEEGEEKSDFWKALDAVSRRQRNKYHSLHTESKRCKHSVRAFHMCSVSGTFEALELQNLARGPHPSAFTVLQSDLLKVAQPGLFVVDDERTVYLWQGAWPEETAQDENVITGSAQSRFNADRICAMQTCLDYCQAKNATRPPQAVLVYGGVEPLEFQNLFPVWEVDEKAKQTQLEDGRREGQTVPIKEYLHKLTQTKYTWEELLERPLPEGVDPSRMEKFLEESEFEKGLGMSQKEFYELPQWKQTNTKREKGLF